MRILIVPVVAVALSLAPEARAQPSRSRSARLLAVESLAPASSLLAGQAEESAPAEPAGEAVPKHAISVSPLLVLGPLLGMYPISIEYEMALNDSLSVYASPGFIYTPGATGGWSIGLSVGARYYLMDGPAIRGLWVGGDVGAEFASRSAGSTFAFVIDALVGYNFLVGGFELSPGIGLALNTGNPNLIGLAYRLNLGYAF